MRRFADRREAGRLLALELAEGGFDERPLVVGLSRGGVIVAAAVAEALGARCDVLVVKKVRAPGSSEQVIGAVAAEGSHAWDASVISESALTAAETKASLGRARKEAGRLTLAWRHHHRAQRLAGRFVILVDDGVVSALTMRAAIRAARRAHAARIIAAAPVMAKAAAEELANEADDTVFVEAPDPLANLADCYYDFSPVGEDEVRAALAEPTAEPGAGRRPGKNKRRPSAGEPADEGREDIGVQRGAKPSDFDPLAQREYRESDGAAFDPHAH